MSDDLTPAMKQYVATKTKYPDCVVMFRMGDFYEMFFEDAKTAARELDIVLTKRGKTQGMDIPLAGIPYHALDTYLAKLIKRGYKVAVCEQMEDPKKAKGVVKRDVVRIITPGTLVEDSLLEEKEHNYLVAVVLDGKRYGIAACDISTGDFKTTVIDGTEQMQGEVKRLSPTEVLLGFESAEVEHFLKAQNFFFQKYQGQHLLYDSSLQLLTNHFQVASLEGFGIQKEKLCVRAAGVLLSYLKETQKNALSYINKVRRYYTEEYMVIDPTTLRNLELLRNMRDNTSKGTLLEAMDKTMTPMGSRLFREWMQWPLLNIEDIHARLDAVEELMRKSIFREDLRELLKECHDIERSLARIGYGNAFPRDMLALRKTLETMPRIRAILEQTDATLLRHLAQLPDLHALVELIKQAIKDEPAATTKDGNVIAQGYSQELDHLRELSSGGKNWIAKLEQKERERSGIKSLKIRFNRVFGYFIEVTKPNLHLVPPEYIRKQTQVNAERFITEELKEQESLILGAEERMVALEIELFMEICKKIAAETPKIQDAAKRLAALDVLLSFAALSVHGRYARPEMHAGYEIEIIAGRHPVIERLQEQFIHNNCRLTPKERMLIITGPNMAGKSTYMRQVACIVLMAHLGCFVPALSARIGIVDRIFTRVGASDDLSAGQSTFMVEMQETANILHHATERSLIVLDEIGRGTSTFDGVSLAWSVACYIASTLKAKTLFATHYHLLNKLEGQVEGVKNYNIAVKETEDDIIFLRKIVEGGTDKSYGVHVAKLAGLPKEVIAAAKNLQATLEEEDKMVHVLEAKLEGREKKRGKKKDSAERHDGQLRLSDVQT